MDLDIKADFDGDVATFTDEKTGVEVLEGQKFGKSLYHMKFIVVHANQEIAAKPAKSQNSLTRRHQRLGHISKKAIKKMAKGGAVDGFKLENEEDSQLCEGYIFVECTAHRFLQVNLEPLKWASLYIPMLVSSIFQHRLEKRVMSFLRMITADTLKCI